MAGQSGWKWGLLTLMSGALVTGCAPKADQIRQIIEDNPDIVYNVIRKDPKKFMDVVNEAVQKARDQQETVAMEEEFKSRKTPQLPADRAYEGDDKALVTIVEYSDFQCPFCKRGHNTMKEVVAAFPGKVRVLFKNFPIERIHPQARIASLYYEAVALQDKAKAAVYKDRVFGDQEALNPTRKEQEIKDEAKFKAEYDKRVEKYLQGVVKEIGADVERAKKDIKGDAVKARMDADRKEGEEFGFSGTPGYLVNGVAVRGAYPTSHFKQVIDRLLAEKK